MTLTPGIDISHWQGKIDWPRVQAAGKIFAFIKATESTTFVDPEFANNWQQAKQAGLVRGAYHFFRPLADPARQADLFLRTVTLEGGDLPPVLDLEISNNLRASTIISKVEIWVKRIEEQTGKKAIIYSSPSFLNTYFQIPAGGPPLWARDHMLWIAHWTAAGVQQPTLPRGWSTWVFWQYSAHGRVDGIRAEVDLNWFNGSVEQLYALVGKDSQTQPYFVQEGDTLVSISEHFGIELRSLVEANPNLIRPGMLLTIPKPPSGSRIAPAKGIAIYIVQPGDTLSAIAERFDTTVERLALDNKVTDPARIVAGQRLVIL